MMPSMSPGLRRSVTKWVSQVSVSVGATLVATMIYGALPKITVPQFEPAPVLTSGGKFAARALPPDAPQAFDGLDTMPLPRVAVPTSVLPVALFVGATQATAAGLQAPRPQVAELQAASTSAGTPAGASPLPEAARHVLASGAPARGASVEAPVRSVKALHLPLRADARHPTRVVVAEAATPDPIAQVSSSMPDAPADQGLLPKMMSSARGAWSITASAGDALLAHVVPQIP